MNKAFTLIELLVVVLIIGILSAIALPQYQKAVHKARFAEVPLRLKSLQQGVEMYVLENGHLASGYKDLMEIDPDMSGGLTRIAEDDDLYRSQHAIYRATCESGGCYILAAYNDQKGQLHSGIPSGALIEVNVSLSKATGQWTKRCYYNERKDMSLGKALCDSLQGYIVESMDP